MTINYNSQHSPIGAWSSFTLGHFGTRGGPSTQVGRPGRSNVFIGVDIDGDGATFLPFFEPAKDRREDFALSPAEATTPTTQAAPLRTFRESDIVRTLGWASDGWKAGPLSVKLVSAFWKLADPRVATQTELKRASCPVVFATLRLDNRKNARSARAMFAIDDEAMRDLESTSGGRLVGIANRSVYGFAIRPSDSAAAFMEFNAQDGFQRAGQRMFRLGKTGGIVLRAAPHSVAEVVIAIGFRHEGVVTTGLDARYFYTRYFDTLESVLEYGLDNWDFYRSEAEARDRELAAAPLNDEQRFLIAHATHGYFGSTEWLEHENRPLWIVNEGEYEMINTFDLTVDQLFFEMRFIPWAVENELDFFVARYSYDDQIKRPNEAELFEGGIAFCHDQGVSNQFAPAGHSSYEQRDLPAQCFSYMAYEELTNWICCAGVYVAKSGDQSFLERHADDFERCYESLLARDDPDPARRNGIMGLDGARTGSGAEITTYDSLDASLGQARNNLYLGVKTWGSYVALEWLFRKLGRADHANRANASAHLSAGSIVARWDAKLGYIPAVFEGGNQSAIIPAIEALVYPKAMGLTSALSESGEYGPLIAALGRHFNAVFRPGICQFDDGGWKLSSTSNNSWMSKIYICQYVARAVLHANFGDAQLAHDRAHADWQRRGSAYWACSDQMASGVAIGSRYYPRLVTNCLWLEET